MTVEQLIGDLLLQHNCVVVPSFGGFVARRVSARFDRIKGTIEPPKKALLFNRQLINNDGLLIASLAHHNRIDFDSAHLAVNETVAKWEKGLSNGERIAIDRVGFLYLDPERNLCFEQDKFYNLLLESYGLGKIHFVSAQDAEARTTHDAVREFVRETVEQPVVEFETGQPLIVNVVEPEVTKAEAPVIPIHRRKRSATWKYIAAAVILPVGFYSFWIPMKTDVLQSGMLSLADFNPFKTAEKPVYSPKKSTYTVPAEEAPSNEIPDNAESYSYQLDEETYIPVKASAATPSPSENPKAELPQTVVAKPVKNAPSAGSIIVVGCFGNAANAEKMAAELRAKGYDAQTIPASGMTRVSAGKGTEFSVLQPKLIADGYKPWLLK